MLLKQGATLVTEAADIIAALTPMTGPRRTPLEAGVEENEGLTRLEPPPLLGTSDSTAVLTALGPAPVEVDEVARAAGLPVRAARLILMELDLAGRIEHHGQQLVSLRPDTGP